MGATADVALSSHWLRRSRSTTASFCYAPASAIRLSCASAEAIVDLPDPAAPLIKTSRVRHDSNDALGSTGGRPNRMLHRPDPEVRSGKSGSDSGCLPMRPVSGHAILFVSGQSDRDTRERTS